eukprot:365052-Chlamydomonas_euryale.AAC.44
MANPEAWIEATHLHFCYNHSMDHPTVMRCHEHRHLLYASFPTQGPRANEPASASVHGASSRQFINSVFRRA